MKSEFLNHLREQNPTFDFDFDDYMTKVFQLRDAYFQAYPELANSQEEDELKEFRKFKEKQGELWSPFENLT